MIKNFSIPSLIIGLLITLTSTFVTYEFLKLKSKQQAFSDKSTLASIGYQVLEGMDYLIYDLRMKALGESTSQAPVILITVDDASIEQIGRWPWDRNIISQLIQNTLSQGVKVIGLDVIFSEPQTNPLAPYYLKQQLTTSQLPSQIEALLYPDNSLKNTIQNFRSQVVLGSFPDEGMASINAPFTDYCRNQAFSMAKSSMVMSPENISFVVIDNADPFESVDFSNLFNPIFEHLEQSYIKNELPKVFFKNIEQLLPQEISRLQILLNQNRMRYCQRWLSDKDEFIETSIKFFESIQDGPLASVEKAKRWSYFKNNIKIYPFNQYDSWTINHKDIQGEALYTASFAAHQDEDGKIRRLPLFFRTGNRLGLSFIPSLALQTYLAINPSYQAQVEIDIDPKNSEQKIITSVAIVDTSTNEIIQKIPVNNRGQILIKYSGSRNMFAYVPAKEILNNSDQMTIYQKLRPKGSHEFFVAQKTVNKKEFLKNKVALIGATATAVYDLRVTPFDKNYPGPETHLTALANLIEQNYLKSPPWEFKYLPYAIIVLGLLITLWLSYFGPLTGVIFLGFILSSLLTFDIYLYKNGSVFSLLFPFLLILILFISITLVKYFTEERKKRELRSTFSKYVSPSIVDEILSSPDNIELGGKKQNVSIFFSDVRGFTTISEKLDPHTLTQVLNRYLTPMTQIVFNNKGTLDKYMGDAVMAFFGAPLGFSDHPQMACQAALDSIKKLKLIQDEFQKEGLPLIDIGIGINTADVNVGNMGSDTVRSYTVMGDGVNLASRLEGINKEYGTRIVISEFTYELVKETFLCRELDWVKVKGKNKPVVIYELLGKKGENHLFEPFLNTYQNAIEQYHLSQFDFALSNLNQIIKEFPSDPVTGLYIERCTEYTQSPPPSDWDGVHTMKTK